MPTHTKLSHTTLAINTLFSTLVHHLFFIVLDIVSFIYLYIYIYIFYNSQLLLVFSRMSTCSNVSTPIESDDVYTTHLPQSRYGYGLSKSADAGSLHFEFNDDQPRAHSYPLNHPNPHPIHPSLPPVFQHRHSYPGSFLNPLGFTTQNHQHRNLEMTATNDNIPAPVSFDSSTNAAATARYDTSYLRVPVHYQLAPPMFKAKDQESLIEYLLLHPSHSNNYHTLRTTTVDPIDQDKSPALHSSDLFSSASHHIQSPSSPCPVQTRTEDKTSSSNDQRPSSVRGEETKKSNFKEAHMIAQTFSKLSFDEVAAMIKDQKRSRPRFLLYLKKSLPTSAEGSSSGTTKNKNDLKTEDISKRIEYFSELLAKRHKDIFAIMYLLSVLSPIFVFPTSELFFNYSRICAKYHLEPLTHPLLGKILKFLRPDMRKAKKIFNGIDMLFYFSNTKTHVDSRDISKEIDRYIGSRLRQENYSREDITHHFVSDGTDESESVQTDMMDSVPLNTQESDTAMLSPDREENGSPEACRRLIELPQLTQNSLIFKFTPQHGYDASYDLHTDLPEPAEVATYSLGTQSFHYIDLNEEDTSVTLSYYFRAPEITCHINSTLIETVEFISSYSRYCENKLNALQRFQNKKYFQEITKINLSLSSMRIHMLFEKTETTQLDKWVIECDRSFYKAAVMMLLELLNRSVSTPIVFQLFIMGKQLSANSVLYDLPSDLISRQITDSIALESIISQLAFILATREQILESLLLGDASHPEAENDESTKTTSFLILEHDDDDDDDEDEDSSRDIICTISVKAESAAKVLSVLVKHAESREQKFECFIKFITTQTTVLYNLIHDSQDESKGSNVEESHYSDMISRAIHSSLIKYFHIGDSEILSTEKVQNCRRDLEIWISQVVELRLSCKSYVE